MEKEKAVRSLKVYGQGGYGQNGTPMIMLKGNWLQKLGFEIEDYISVASIPNTPEEWLDGFNTFSIYQVLPQLIELWGLNVQTDVEAKKNFARQTVK